MSNPVDVPQKETCPERLRLTLAVIKASELVNLQQGEQARVSRQGKPLAEAMKAERLAIAALDQHRTEHGC